MTATDRVIRICLAEDHAIVRQGLRNMLGEDGGFEILGEAADGEALLELLREKKPDIVIVDLSMPGLGGMELIRRLQESHPDLRVVVLTMHREYQFFRLATANRNVAGYLLKDDAFDRLSDALRVVADGGRAFSPRVQELIFEDYQLVREGYNILDLLTAREREVLSLLVGGKKNREIANDLFISTRTVESHRAKIMEKLRCRNFAELMQFAAKNGLV